MTIIDTTSGIQDIFIDGHFNLSKWEEYMDKFVPGAKDICLNDMMDCRNAGYTWEKDYLPILIWLKKSLIDLGSGCMSKVDYEIVLANEEDEDVDSISFWDDNLRPEGELARLAVYPDEQSKGYGKIMLRHGMEELKRRGYKVQIIMR